MGWHRVAAEEELNCSTAEMRGAPGELRRRRERLRPAQRRQRLGLEFNVLALIGRHWPPEPWTPVNSLTWGKAMAFNLGGNLDYELLRAALIAKARVDLAMPCTRPTRQIVRSSCRRRRRRSSCAGRAAQAVHSPTLAPRLAPCAASRQTGEPQRPAARPRDRQQQLGARRRAHDNGQAAAGQRSAPRHSDAVDLVPGRLALPPVSPACPYDVVGVSFAGRAGRDHRPQRAHRLGCDQHRPGRARPVHREPHPQNPDASATSGSRARRKCARKSSSPDASTSRCCARCASRAMAQS